MAWYNDDIQDVPIDIRQLFEAYSGISSEDVVPHVLKIVSIFADGLRSSPLHYQTIFLLVPIFRDPKHLTSAPTHALVNSNFSS